MCDQHGTFEHTVFQGMKPIKVRLCASCAGKVGADQHLAKIKGAADHAAKAAAVDAFLKAVGK
jgi:hypothetical protein